MPQFTCAMCGKEYDSKEFSVNNSDYCSMACVQKMRAAEEERARLKKKAEGGDDHSRIDHFNSGGGSPCF